ncbi:NDR1/HIN1-like protein 26 [Macadamia integrifolia]|uniref:NDR1/HIN1-like protein 26 n=1 Tax=Macadamia integrifolia TaxID=60698 RepID=UPI001C4FE3FB|nr:NDR1/HIN1-like protein 26 [Macadamia integrifolia]
MSENGEIPIHTAPANQPKRRHTARARYYAHRVRESLTTRISKFVCSIFLVLLLVLGVVFFIVWLSVRPHRPRFHISTFSFPTLVQDNGFENAQVSFNVTIRNPNQDIGIYYYSMNSSLYYQEKRIGGEPLPLPSATLPYYQEPQSTMWISAQLGVPTSLVITDERWAALMADKANGKVWFRLELTSVIRFKVSTWEGKHHKMHASCQVVVGQDGMILPVSRDTRCPLYFS